MMRACDSRAVPVATMGLLFGCLGFQPEDGEPNNIVSTAERSYLSLSGAGFGILEDGAASIGIFVAPPQGAAGVHDLSLEQSTLYALDAIDGRIFVYDVGEDPPLLIAEVEGVPVGPFSGIAARPEAVVVSGGTSELTVWRREPDGRLGSSPARLDLDRGQPDLSLSADGRFAFVSTHFEDDVDGHEFGLTAVEIRPAGEAPTRIHAIGLEGAGFTGGTSNPANFPIVSALAGDDIVVAHGGGLDVLAFDGQQLRLLRHVGLPVEATSVCVTGTTAYVVGIEPTPQLLVVDFEAGVIKDEIALPENSRPTGVGRTTGAIVVAAQSGGVLVFPREAD